MAGILLLKVRKIVLTNNQEKKMCQKLNGYIEVLIGATIALNLTITILSGPEKWFESVMMTA